MPPTPEQHERDHERMQRAWDVWVERGRPQVNARRDPGGKKRASRRTLGLRLQAHMAVCHGEPDIFGPSFRRPFGSVTFQQVWDMHKEMHDGE